MKQVQGLVRINGRRRPYGEEARERASVYAQERMQAGVRRECVARELGVSSFATGVPARRILFVGPVVWGGKPCLG
jgi:hypothetical protein